MRKRFLALLLSIIILSSALLFTPLIVYAAPSGEVSRDPDVDNFINTGELVTEEIIFRNTADDDPEDVASTIQYITLAAANLNPSVTSIESTASWEIYDPDDNLRVSGTVDGFMNTEIFAPYSTTTSVDIYTWNLGPPSDDLDAYTDSDQFEDDDELKILRPSEYLILTVTINCEEEGDSEIWFFFRASELEPEADDLPITDITDIPFDDTPDEDISDPYKTQRMNLFYQDESLPIRPVGFWPLHNSYDPYDLDIDTGHRFEQVGDEPPDGLWSWTRDPTTTAFAKNKKMVHQTGIPPQEEEASIHICGFKFRDLNLNGEFDEGEPKIDGVTITLLGADGETLAQDYYSGDFNLIGDNPEETGADGLIGHYCFNLENVDPNGGDNNDGIYVFFIEETLPEGSLPTTPTIIGPIIVEVEGGEEFNFVGNEFGNTPPINPVGGTLIPFNNMKIGSLASFALLALMASIIFGFIIAKRRKFWA